MVVFFQAEDGIRDVAVTGVQTCALPISCKVKPSPDPARRGRPHTSFCYGQQAGLVVNAQHQAFHPGGRKAYWTADHDPCGVLPNSVLITALAQEQKPTTK